MTLWLSLFLTGLPLVFAVNRLGQSDAARARQCGRAGAAVLLTLFTAGIFLQFSSYECAFIPSSSNGLGVAQAMIGVFLLLRFVGSSWVLRQMKAERVPGNSDYPVFLNSVFSVPAAWQGLGESRILFPQKLWSELAPTSRDLILSHEEAHLRGHDLWWRWALTAGLWLSFGNPAFYLLRRELMRLDEFNADDASLAKTRASRADLVRLFLKIQGPAPRFAVGFPGEITARAERLLRQPTQSIRRGGLALAFSVWSLAAVTASAFDARIVDAEFGPAGIELRRTEIRFGILNSLLQSTADSELSDFNQPQCRRNP